MPPVPPTFIRSKINLLYMNKKFRLAYGPLRIRHVRHTCCGATTYDDYSLRHP